MIPENIALDALLQFMWKAADPDLRAYAANYLFEERVSLARQQSYEHSIDTAGADFGGWDRWHRDYLWQAIHQEVPETFTTINGDAAHSGELAPGQYLVRVEGLEHALGKTGYGIDELNTALEVAHTGKSQGKYSVADATAALARLCESLNENPFSVRPRFAGFLQDVEETLSAADWPDQIRDRFGLAHYTPAPERRSPS